jgi:hypothetical protein
MAFPSMYDQLSHLIGCCYFVQVWLVVADVLALTAAPFLINALHVWESMVLKIGKERANLPMYMLL